MSRIKKLKPKFKVGLVLIILIILFLILYKFPKKNNNVNKNNTTTTKVAEIDKKVNISLFGDILIEGPFYRSMNKYDEGDIYFKKVNDKYFTKDDLSIGNMEVPISSEDKFLGDAYQFVSPPSIGNLIAKQSIEVLGTANNHAYDQYIDGINSTIDFFNDNNILTVGTVKNKEDRNTPKIIEKNGIKIGFAAYTLFTNIKPEQEDLWRICYYREPYSRTYEEYKENMKKELTNLVNNSDVQIVLMHWGNEFTYNLTDDQKDMAKFLSDLGIDIVLGSHSHNIQPIEYVGDTLVFYSMGNFASADAELDRSGDEFSNNYQIGLLANLDITYKDNKVNIANIKTEPIINYFNSNEEHYELIPLSDYTSEYETTHYRYNKGLNKEFINNTYNKLIDKQFR